MTITLNGNDYEVKRVSESIDTSRRLAVVLGGVTDLEALKADVDAHGTGVPLVITRDDGSKLTYAKGCTRVDRIERTITSGGDDDTAIDFNMTDKAPDENIVIEPKDESAEAPVEETPAAE